MADPPSKPSPQSAQIITASILAGAAIIAAVGTFLPGLIGLTGMPAIVLQLVFYLVAAIDVAVALWLRARLRKVQSSRGGTVQRQ